MADLLLECNNRNIEYQGWQADSYELMFYQLPSQLTVMLVFFHPVVNNVRFDILSDLHPRQKFYYFWTKSEAFCQVLFVHLDQQACSLSVPLHHFLRFEEPKRSAKVPQVVTFTVHLGIIKKAELVKTEQRYEYDVIRVRQLKLHYEFRGKQPSKLRNYILLNLFQGLPGKDLVEFKLELFRVILRNVSIIMGKFLAVGMNMKCDECIKETYLIEKLFIKTVFKKIVSFGPSTSTDNRKSWASACLWMQRVHQIIEYKLKLCSRNSATS